MKTFKQYLGPEATKANDSAEISRQKEHLTHKAKSNYEQSAREKMFGHGGAAEAKAKSYENARDNIGEEFAAAPTNSVAGVAGTGDARLPSAQREPGVSKKRNPLLKGMFTRKQPKV
jgi:hypothetical protein